MKKNIIMRYIEENCDKNNLPKVLPFFHSCEGSKGIKIIQDGELKTHERKEFDKKLLYFYYGKPSYPVGEKYTKKRADDYYCPVCFIINPENLPMYEVYPFDKDEFNEELYKGFIMSELENYKLEPSLESIQTYISAMFGNNTYYLEGKCIRSDSSLIEIDALINMFNARGEVDIDERSNTVDIICNENIKIEDFVECIIMPNTMLRSDYVIKFLDTHNIKYKTYQFRPLTKPERYYEIVFQLAMDHIQERSN